MFFPLLLIALLCAETVSSEAFEFVACDYWACFVPPSCVGSTGDILLTDIDYSNNNSVILVSCSAFMMIRPATAKRWKVIIGWTDPSTTEVTVSHGSQQLFSCINISNHLAATSTLTSYEETLQSPEIIFLPYNVPMCHFFVGDDNEVLKKLDQFITIKSNYAENSLQDSKFFEKIEKRTVCDFTKILFDPTALPEEVVEPVCHGTALGCWMYTKRFELQVKIGAVYENVNHVWCRYNGTTNQYHYQIQTESSTRTTADNFYARCYAKRCLACGEPEYLITDPGKTAPTLTNVSGDCETLTCPNFFRNGNITLFGKAECKKGGVKEDSWGWYVESARIFNGKFDCVDEMPCKKVTNTSCSGECQLHPNTSLPYCLGTHMLSATVDGQVLRGIDHIECHTHEGRLYYSGAVSGYFPYETSDVTFHCSLPCKEVTNTSCSGDCKLHPITRIPYCPSTHTLSATVDGQVLRGIDHMECHTHEGLLFYSGAVSGYFPYDMSDVTFQCTVTATSFLSSFLPAFRDLFTVVAAICIVLIFPLLCVIVWLLCGIRKLLAERRESAGKAPKSTEKTAEP